MGYKIYKIQNDSNWSKDKPTISIDESDPNWEEALNNYINGKPPTKDPKWKKGTWGITKKI